MVRMRSIIWAPTDTIGRQLWSAYHCSRNSTPLVAEDAKSEGTAARLANKARRGGAGPRNQMRNPAGQLREAEASVLAARGGAGCDNQMSSLSKQGPMY